jgi:hypothetical protein
LRYIDFNPVSARVCDHPAAYEFGSALAYHAGRPPPWLSTGHARALLVGGFGHPDLVSGYRALVGKEPSADERDLVGSRLSGAVANDDTDDLLARSSAGFRSWVVRKALNADGLRPSLPLASARALEDEWSRRRRENGALRVGLARKSVDAWEVCRAGLLHEFAGCSCEVIARRIGRTNGTISRWVRLHRTLLGEDAIYAELAAAILRIALARSHGIDGS